MNDFRSWYDALNKPAWTPDVSVIGFIWSVLYPIIFVVNGYVLLAIIRRDIPALVGLPFLINLVANFAFTPVQFGLRDLTLAAIVIVIIWATIIWAMIAIWPHARWVTFAFVPYLIWVSIASVLQISITLQNRP